MPGELKLIKITRIVPLIGELITFLCMVLILNPNFLTATDYFKEIHEKLNMLKKQAK